jgi:hypothetical protein
MRSALAVLPGNVAFLFIATFCLILIKLTQ